MQHLPGILDISDDELVQAVKVENKTTVEHIISLILDKYTEEGWICEHCKTHN